MHCRGSADAALVPDSMQKTILEGIEFQEAFPVLDDGWLSKAVLRTPKTMNYRQRNTVITASINNAFQDQVSAFKASSANISEVEHEKMKGPNRTEVTFINGTLTDDISNACKLEPGADFFFIDLGEDVENATERDSSCTRQLRTSMSDKTRNDHTVVVRASGSRISDVNEVAQAQLQPDVTRELLIVMLGHDFDGGSAPHSRDEFASLVVFLKGPSADDKFKTLDGFHHGNVIITTKAPDVQLTNGKTLSVAFTRSAIRQVLDRFPDTQCAVFISGGVGNETIAALHCEMSCLSCHASEEEMDTAKSTMRSHLAGELKAQTFAENLRGITHESHPLFQFGCDIAKNEHIQFDELSQMEEEGGIDLTQESQNVAEHTPPRSSKEGEDTDTAGPHELARSRTPTRSQAASRSSSDPSNICASSQCGDPILPSELVRCGICDKTLHSHLALRVQASQ